MCLRKPSAFLLLICLGPIKAASLPSSFLDAVVAVGVRPLIRAQGPEAKPVFTRGNFEQRASGILYSYTLERKVVDEKTGRTELSGDLYLVTAKHVIEGILPLEEQEVSSANTITGGHLAPTLYIRFNPHDLNKPRDIEVPLRTNEGPLCLLHPIADAAVCPIDGDHSLLNSDINFWAFDGGFDVADREKLKTMGAAEGDDVFVLGFPVSLMNAGSDPVDVVVSRQGSIARIRDYLSGATNSFLVDLFVYPGNSGGPVILRPELFTFDGMPPNNRVWLIGIVSEYLPYRDIAASRQTGHDRIVFEENSGLARVTPMDFVEELVLQHRKRGNLPLAQSAK